MAGQLGLHIISKMRADAALFLSLTPEQKKEYPHRKYAARLDYANLPEDGLCSCTSEHGYCTEVYQVTCLHKDFAEPLNVVIVVKTHVASARRGHVVLFSTDLSLKADLLVDYYTLRFQIEFSFRDAKQHFGLEDWMGVTKTAVTNGIGVSLFMVNLSSYLLGAFRVQYPGAGIVDLKGFYRGRHYLEAVLKLLADRPDGIICGRLLDQVSRLGSIHGRPKEAPDLEMAA